MATNLERSGYTQELGGGGGCELATNLKRSGSADETAALRSSGVALETATTLVATLKQCARGAGRQSWSYSTEHLHTVYAKIVPSGWWGGGEGAGGCTRTGLN